MQIAVECHAGYRGDEEPRMFVVGDHRLEVVEIRDRWHGPEHRYFRVLASDGNVYVLRHDERTAGWSLQAFRSER